VKTQPDSGCQRRSPRLLGRAALLALSLFVLACFAAGPAQAAPAPKLVALTFDDGPSRYTAQVLAVLEAKKAPATFFFLGQQVGAYPGIVSRLRATGFEVENHTWDHRTLTRLSTAAIRREITRTSQLLGGVKYLRPPGGSYNARVLGIVHSLGLKLVLWSVDTLDWKYHSVSSILRYLRAEVRPGAIVLMHDGGGNRSQTVAALPKVIDWLRSHGYTLVRVDQLGAAARRGTIK
jgi:peptidoglycan-N-acetylglucosamine deacetylase